MAETRAQQGKWTSVAVRSSHGAPKAQVLLPRAQPVSVQGGLKRRTMVINKAWVGFKELTASASPPFPLFFSRPLAAHTWEPGMSLACASRSLHSDLMCAMVRSAATASFVSPQSARWPLIAALHPYVTFHCSCELACRTLDFARHGVANHK